STALLAEDFYRQTVCLLVEGNTALFIILLGDEPILGPADQAKAEKIQALVNGLLHQSLLLIVKLLHVADPLLEFANGKAGGVPLLEPLGLRLVTSKLVRQGLKGEKVSGQVVEVLLGTGHDAQTSVCKDCAPKKCGFLRGSTHI